MPDCESKSCKHKALDKNLNSVMVGHSKLDNICFSPDPGAACFINKVQTKHTETHTTMEKTSFLLSDFRPFACVLLFIEGILPVIVIGCFCVVHV